MRLALSHNLTSGGSQREAFELMKHLVENGHTVDLFTPTTANLSFLPLTDIARNHFSFPLRLRGDFRYRIPGLRRYLELLTLGLDLRALRRCARAMAAEIDSNGYDFVFAHHDRLVQSPYLLRYLRTPSVYYCAEPMREFYDPQIHRDYAEPMTPIDRAQRVWYRPALALRRDILREEDARNVRYATVILTNSFFSAESIYRAYGLRPQVCYLGVDTERFRPMSAERDNLVLSVGAVSPLKGYDFLVESIGKIVSGNRPRLVVIGNTASAAEVEYLRRLASDRGVDLRFEIDVSEDDLVRWYNRARAFVYSPILEPFGLAPLEAMACGLPVVAVNEGGVRESVRDGETGLLVPRDPESFAVAIDSLRSCPELRDRLADRGRKEALRYWSWERACERFRRIVAKSLGLTGESRDR
ncbi:MAG: glycosyltransferase family 4 protein [Vicinamibacteria bacterium]